jgi:hypothetical protein
VPKLVGLAAKRKPVIRRNYFAVRADGAEDDKMRAGALRADLCHFRRAEAPRKCKLKLVGHLLVSKNQNGIFLERGTHGGIDLVIRGDIGKRHAAQFGAKARPGRNDVHRQILLVFVVEGYGKLRCAATRGCARECATVLQICSPSLRGANATKQSSFLLRRCYGLLRLRSQ